MKVIIVTGTPGTGKTALSMKLAKKLAFRYLDVGSIIKKCNFSEDYDEKRKTHIVDAKKLNRELVREIMNCKKTEKGVIIDSHLSHYLPKKYVDLCIVTKCNLRVLEKRLRKKKYFKAKIRENMDVEIFDICLNEAKDNKHKIFIVDTTKGINIKKISGRVEIL